MKNVKYLLMFVTISACLFASSQRVDALGGNVGYWADDDNSYTAFPASINGGNLAQISGINSTMGSAVVRWGEGTKWGFKWNEGNNNEMINLQYGNGDYGATFGLSMSAGDDGIETNGDATSSMGLTASYGRTMDFGEIGVGFSNTSSDDGVTADVGETADDDIKTMGLWVNLRRDQSLWIFDKMLVNFAYGTNNCGQTEHPTNGTWSCPDVHPTDGDAGEPDAQTTMDLGVNFYTHIGIGENTTALVAMGFGYESIANRHSIKDKASTAITLPNWTVGVESHMTDWATVRVGLNSSYTLTGTTNSGVADAKM